MSVYIYHILFSLHTFKRMNDGKNNDFQNEVYALDY